GGGKAMGFGKSKARLLTEKSTRITFEDVAGIEAPQAEPFSDYYRYFPGSTVLVQSDWDLGNETCGCLKVGLTEQVEPNEKGPLRGVVLKVYNDRGRVLAKADPALRTLTIKTTVDARWVRTQTRGLPGTEQLFFEHIQRQDPRSTKLKQNQLKGGYLSIYAAIFPEQHKWRDESGHGWVFACRVTRDKIAAVPQKHLTGYGR
ncbi:MAG: hypothetical protein IH889_05655, partial [Planctomycetes bacterium]|nr:hypothetical protein [Planctomycetota bacterium]